MGQWWRILALTRQKTFRIEFGAPSLNRRDLEGRSVARVLCTGADSVLLVTRKLILEHAGHTVPTALGEAAAAAACRDSDFQVVVIGQSISPKDKKVLASLARRYCPSARILELYGPHQSRALEDADAWLEVPASPAASPD